MQLPNEKSKQKIYHYAAYGMRINSEIMLPELATAEGGNSDVKIIYGEVPDNIAVPFAKTDSYQAASSEFLFRIPGVAAYHVSNGTQIIVQPYGRDDFSLGRLFLLGTVMVVLLMQRGIFPIHGSTVVVNGRGVIFTGLPGAGKSTMAAGLYKRGYSIQADDISAVTCEPDGVCRVLPGYPQQKLYQDSADIIGIDTTDFANIFGKRGKFAVPVADGFSSSPVSVAAIYEIVTAPCPDVSIAPLKGIAKLTTVMDNTFQAELVNGLGLNTVHFRQSAKVVNQVRVFRLMRPENVVSLDRQIKLLLEHFMNLPVVNRDWNDNWTLWRDV